MGIVKPMYQELPIACSLDAEQLSERLDQIRAIGYDALLDSHTEPTRAALRFAASEPTTARLEAIVAAEARCCPFMQLTLSSAGADQIVLTVEVPDGAQPVLSEFVAAFERPSR
jgi:hypothetical protein